jgi:peptidoglycan-associated lipoprotein
MKKLSLFKITALVVVVFSLAACSHKKAPNATTLTPETSEASAMGAGADEGFGETSDNIHTYCHPSMGKDHYYFDFDQDIIRDDDMTSLRNQIDYLVAHNSTKVRVEGNTDERGSKEYNIALGYRRAKAVARILEQGGIASNRIRIVSYGEEKPISFGHDESFWQCNRRVDLVYGDN